MVLSLLFLVTVLAGVYVTGGMSRPIATQTPEPRETFTATATATCGAPCATYTPSATPTRTPRPEPTSTPTRCAWCEATAAPPATVTP